MKSRFISPLPYLNRRSESKSAEIPVITRPPLPPFPTGSYEKELPWIPPISRDYLRADSWGVTIPGAPWVPGGSSEHPERILSWFLDRFPMEWQHKYLSTYAGYGYTHLRLSYPDSVAPATGFQVPGANQTPEQFIQTCKLVKSYGLYVRVMLASKVYQQQDMNFEQWKAYADPIMNLLFDNEAADEITPGWEWNLFNVPGKTTTDIFKHTGKRCHSADISCWCHFSPHYTSWPAPGDDRGRFGFWDDLGSDIDGIDYQGQAEWDIPEMQARIVDTLWEFGDREKQGKFVPKFRFDEDVAIVMFSHDHPNEDEANLRGYCACCTTDNVKNGPAKVWGFGNGGRRPDGSRI